MQGSFKLVLNWFEFILCFLVTACFINTYFVQRESQFHFKYAERNFEDYTAKQPSFANNSFMRSFAYSNQVEPKKVSIIWLNQCIVYNMQPIYISS